MRKTIALALLLLVAADFASAQRRGGMGGAGRGGLGGRRGGEGRGGDMALPEAAEFRKLNPAGLIVDNRKKVGLSDAQVSALAAMRDRSRDGNESLLVHYDSIRKEVGTFIASRRERRGEQQQADSTQRGGDGMQAMRTMRFLLDSLSARRAADVRAVLEYLTDEKQHREAAKLLNDQDLTFQEKLPRMGGRGRRGRRGGGPDDRPPRR